MTRGYEKQYRKYESAQTQQYEKKPSVFKGILSCKDCGVFIFGFYDKKTYKTMTHFVLRCVACNDKIMEELDGYRGVKIDKVIDTQGKEIKVDPTT